MKETRNEIAWFLIPTFILTFGLGGVALFMGGLKQFPLLALPMYIPALVVIILYKFKFKKPIFKANDLGLNFRRIGYWFWGIMITFLLIASSFFISSWIKPDFFQNIVSILEDTEKTGLGVGNWYLNLLLIFGINTLIAPLLNIWMFLGEEIGWRAFLFPRLLKIYDPKISFLICGIIWGVWHAFGIWMGHNYPDNPIIGIFMMVLFCIPMSVIFQYIYFKSKSIIAVALAHGVMNWTAGNFIMYVVADPDYNKLIYGPTGIIGIAIFWLTAYAFYKKMDWVDNNPLVN